MSEYYNTSYTLIHRIKDRYDDDAWQDGVEELVAKPDRVVVTEAGRAMDEAVRAARVGSELWPLFVVLAVLCAIAESLVSRFMARDETA